MGVNFFTSNAAESEPEPEVTDLMEIARFIDLPSARRPEWVKRAGLRFDIALGYDDDRAARVAGCMSNASENGRAGDVELATQTIAEVFTRCSELELAGSPDEVHKNDATTCTCTNVVADVQERLETIDRLGARLHEGAGIDVATELQKVAQDIVYIHLMTRTVFELARANPETFGFSKEGFDSMDKKIRKAALGYVKRHPGPKRKTKRK